MLVPPWKIQDRYDRYVTYGSYVVLAGAIAMTVSDDFPVQIFVTIDLVWCSFVAVGLVRMLRRTKMDSRELIALIKARRYSDLPGDLQEEIKMRDARRHLERKPE